MSPKIYGSSTDKQGKGQPIPCSDPNSYSGCQPLEYEEVCTIEYGWWYSDPNGPQCNYGPDIGCECPDIMWIC